MNKRVLITGGAGFIGSYLTDNLIQSGYSVRILDNLEDQVHHGRSPSYLNAKAEFMKGDIREYEIFKNSLQSIDYVFHLASKVGVGQSNYQIRDYTEANILGMANLLDIIVNNHLPVKKIIMTASMTSYGEGNYRCETCGIIKPQLRSEEQMKKKDWNMHCPNCGSIIRPIPTNEGAQLSNNSIYSITKHVQEELLLHIGKTYGIPVVSLRCFNVYGPRQSLSNPYTGVSAIFISRLKNNNQPVVYEDGFQTRDFVSVHDVVRALAKATISRKANGEIINIGSGKPVTIKYLAEILSSYLHKNIEPELNGNFRKNDIRHCYADISKAKNILGWEPQISLAEGLTELIEWSKNQRAMDSFVKAEEKLKENKLL